jgi:RNA polymerase sigma-70 factor (ECF subfamily)
LTSSAAGLSQRVRSADPGTRALDEGMERYARGEDPAFDDVYRRGAPRVRGFLLRLCGDPSVADDLTQETFLRAHHARGRFEPGAAALPWLFAIARNAFFDRRRREAVRPTEPLQDGAAEPEAGGEARGDEVLAAREAMDVVRATLDRLTPLQREAFVLLRFEGMSVSEAAQVLGTTESAVKVRAFRAYEALREALSRRDAQRGRDRRGGGAHG